MTREEAISKVKGYLTDTLPLDAYDEVEEIMKALKQESKQKWISVSERLPEEDKSVIVSVEHEIFPETVFPEARYTKRYGKYRWEWASESIIGCWEELAGVTAWMPLPEPYKPQEGEDRNEDNN